MTRDTLMLSSMLMVATLTGAAFTTPSVGVAALLPESAPTAFPHKHLPGKTLTSLSDSLPDNSVSGPLVIVPPVSEPSEFSEPSEPSEFSEQPADTTDEPSPEPAASTPEAPPASSPEVAPAATSTPAGTPEAKPEEKLDSTPLSPPDETSSDSISEDIETVPEKAETVAPPSPPAPQAALRVAFGGAIDEETAQSVAEHAVRVLALEQAARNLSRKPGVRLFAGDVSSLMALCAPLLTLDMQVGAVAHPVEGEIRTAPSRTPDDALLSTQDEESAAPGELRATARWEQYRSEDDFLRELIQSGKSLDSQALAYAQSRRLTAECLRLLRDAATLRRAGGDDTPQADRLSVLLSQLDDLDLFLRGPFPPEAAKLERLLARNPGNPAYLMEYAELLIRADQPSKALDVLKSLSNSPRLSGQIFYLRGLANLALRLPALAHDDFSRALKLNPESPGYWQARALAFAALDDTERMCKDLTQACALGLCTDLERVRLSGYCREF